MEEIDSHPPEPISSIREQPRKMGNGWTGQEESIWTCAECFHLWDERNRFSASESRAQSQALYSQELIIVKRKWFSQQNCLLTGSWVSQKAGALQEKETRQLQEVGGCRERTDQRGCPAGSKCQHTDEQGSFSNTWVHQFCSIGPWSIHSMHTQWPTSRHIPGNLDRAVPSKFPSLNHTESFFLALISPDLQLEKMMEKIGELRMPPSDSQHFCAKECPLFTPNELWIMWFRGKVCTRGVCKVIGEPVYLFI